MNSTVKIKTSGRGFEMKNGERYSPFGVNYYRPGTGWAPQVWKLFDEDATRRDFELLRELGANCVRVFLTFGSFYPQPGRLDVDGLKKFDRFLALADEAGLYVHPTGPDHWEGIPAWANTDRYADEAFLSALADFWRLFAGRYKGHPTIFAYDLLNEPSVPWKSRALEKRWGRPVPEPREGAADILEYQHFRESIAAEWTRIQSETIKETDPDALVTVGLIQWSIPALLPRLEHYSGFKPERIHPYLDFQEIHFYPLDPPLRYEEEEIRSNLAYLDILARHVARLGKPLVIAEFGWYGGGCFGDYPEATEEDQASWCSAVVESTIGLACGWLNWGFYDQPEARDVSVLTGLLTSEGKMKAWGDRFAELARTDRERSRSVLPDSGSYPEMDWDACIVSASARNSFRQKYRRYYDQTH